MSEWRTRAACRSVDPEVFFPTAEVGPVYDAQVAVAKAVCAGCPVRPECLAEALTRIPYGIAGGLTAEERRGARTATTSAAAALKAGLRPDAQRQQVEAAGRVLLLAGRPRLEVATRCGVTERTVTNWVRRLRAPDRPPPAEAAQAEESRGGHRAPLLISHTHNPQPGTRTQEGHPL